MISFVSRVVSGWEELGHILVEGFIPAVALVVKWLYDWQALIAGICAIIAAIIWGRAVIKAAELRAGSVRPSRSPIPRQLSALSPPPPRDLRVQESEAAAMSAPELVERLRVQIRVLLGRIPHSEEPLNAGQLSMCKGIANFTIDPTNFKREAPREAYAALKKDLSALSSMTRGTTCLTAWKALTAVNKTARNLEAALQGEAISTQ